MPRIVSGILKNTLIDVPENLQDVRPTSSKVRDAVFNALQFAIEDSIFLDFFAGSGAMGFEAASRGASTVMFIEKNRAVANVLRQNIQHIQQRMERSQKSMGLSVCNFELVPIDAEKAWGMIFRNLESIVDGRDIIVWVDPPYDYVEKWFKDMTDLFLQTKVKYWFVLEYGDIGKKQPEITLPNSFALHKEKKYGHTHVKIWYHNQ